MIRFLHLPLKARWFRMIQSGEKREEYREVTPYWMKRIGMRCSSCHEKGAVRFCITECDELKWDRRLFCHYTHVHFTLGYPRRDDHSRHMVRKIKDITIGTGRPEWGAEPGKEYFVIKLED